MKFTPRIRFNRIRVKSIVFLVVLFLLNSCQSHVPIEKKPIPSTSHQKGTVETSFPEIIKSDEYYLIYIHGKIIEDKGINAVSPQFGPYEFEEILRYFADSGINVIGEIRNSPTDVEEYSDRVSQQVNSLIKQGLPSKNIFLVGFSKGAWITIQTSSKLKNPDLNYVLIGVCGEELFRDVRIELSGRILSLYEESDEYGSTCKPLIDRSPQVTEFKEIVYATGKQHGTFYSADPDWLDPIITWIYEVDS
jgi:hypothetical protein